MAYEAKILADSIHEGHGNRLTTFQVTYPRFVHAELMTHRVFSRNSASSRAIPVAKMLANINQDPATPVWWGKNQPGMQAREELEGEERKKAEMWWLIARDAGVMHANNLNNLGVHKQIVNRVTEPWMWITVIVSSTSWSNFFDLRCHQDAQPEIKEIAEMMKDLYFGPPQAPKFLKEGEWHLPLWGFEGDDEEGEEEVALKAWGIGQGSKQIILPKKVAVSIGRCARVSYLTHEGIRDLSADIDLCNRLVAAGHWSPFEHVATPFTAQHRQLIYDLQDRITTSPVARNLPTHLVNEVYDNLWMCGNFRGWRQARKFFPFESGEPA
jgi:thymidylate synthase ThyX